MERCRDVNEDNVEVGVEVDVDADVDVAIADADTNTDNVIDGEIDSHNTLMPL